MTYLEALQLINSIEAQYDMMSIRYKGVSVWPYLRLYLLDEIAGQTEVKASGPIIKIVLKSLFAYNPLKVFKYHEVWLFTGCERRKLVGDKMIHRISGGISSILNNYLMIEKPSTRIGHYPKKDIEEREIVSEAWLILITRIIERISRLTPSKIENEVIIRQVLIDRVIDFDYRHYIRLLNAKRLSLLLLLKIIRKPKLAMMECPYVSMGYMWALHQSGVKIIELQHGVINKNHNAYNAKAYEFQMKPNSIFVFGTEEYKYFTEEEPQYASDVQMTGLYMLEKANECSNKDIFEKYRSQYESIVVVAGQIGYEIQLAEMIEDVAEFHQEMLFFYIPRLVDTNLVFKVKNVIVKKGINIYEYIKWADLHVTISSTTCLEAQFFQRPTIFYDYEKRASTYYGSILEKDNGCIYIYAPKEFDNAYKLIKQGNFCYKEVFAHNHVERISKILKDYIRK